MGQQEVLTVHAFSALSWQNTDSAYVSVAYDQVKNALSESQAEAEE